MAVTDAQFWDRVAPGYSNKPVTDMESYARKLAATQALMRPNMKILEFGCGTGSTALEHAPHVAHIDATDVSAEMIAIGLNKAHSAGFDESTNYDMVLALNLIHLLKDRKAVLEKVNRLLKPGGLFISSTVCLADRMWYLRPVIPMLQWLGKAPYVEFLSAKDFLDEVAVAGFEIQEYWTHGRANSLFLIARKL